MTITLVFILASLILLIIIFITGRSRKNESSRLNINKWMDMTKEERKAFDYKSTRRSMLKKQDLLQIIRREYKQVQSTKKNNFSDH